MNTEAPETEQFNGELLGEQEIALNSSLEEAEEKVHHLQKEERDLINKTKLWRQSWPAGGTQCWGWQTNNYRQVWSRDPAVEGEESTSGWQTQRSVMWRDGLTAAQKSLNVEIKEETRSEGCLWATPTEKEETWPLQFLQKNITKE